MVCCRAPPYAYSGRLVHRHRNTQRFYQRRPRCEVPQRLRPRAAGGGRRHGQSGRGGHAARHYPLAGSALRPRQGEGSPPVLTSPGAKGRFSSFGPRSGPSPLGTDPAALHRPGGYPKIGGFQPHSPTARRRKSHIPLIFRHVFPGTRFADDGSRGVRRLQEAFESHAFGLRVTEFRVSRPIER